MKTEVFTKKFTASGNFCSGITPAEIKYRKPVVIFQGTIKYSEAEEEE